MVRVGLEADAVHGGVEVREVLHFLAAGFAGGSEAGPLGPRVPGAVP